MKVVVLTGNGGPSETVKLGLSKWNKELRNELTLSEFGAVEEE